MKAIILYHPNSEHDRIVSDFKREFDRRTGKDVELVSLETPDGANKARVYDVTVYPAILALDDNGHLHKMWQGDQLPLIDDVQAYVVS